MGNLPVGGAGGAGCEPVHVPALARLRKKFPEVTVELERNSFRKSPQRLDNCRFDLIITLSFEIEGRRIGRGEFAQSAGEPWPLIGPIPWRTSRIWGCPTCGRVFCSHLQG